MARICINELANYNNGELIFKWFDLDDYSNADDFWEDVNNWLASCTDQYGNPCEEWILGDVEDIPEEFYGEYRFDAEKLFHYQSLVNELGEAKLEAYLSLFSQMPDSASEVNQRLFCETDHFDDEARGFLVQIGVALTERNGLLNNIPEEVTRYFDFAKYGRDHYGQNMGLANGFVFWTA